jgi:predicted dehydrogenase
MPAIKTALLSFGMSGKVFHAPFISVHPGFELVGAWERTKKAIQGIYPDAISYNTMEDLLADDSIELVIVNTPNNTHYNYTKAALIAGKDVVVEKAFTTTVAEAIVLKELALKLNRKISIYHSRRYDSDYRTMQKILQQNLLGDLVEAEFRYDRYKPSIGPKQHKENAGPGAGLLNDLGPHLIDQALTLFGMPSSVFADIRITRPQSQVDDWFNVVLYYPQLRVSLHASNFVREALPAYMLQGTKGSFIKSRTDMQETKLLAGELPNRIDWGVEPASEYGLLHTEKDGVIIKERVPSEVGNYLDYYDGVYNAIRKGAPMPVTCHEATDVMRIIEAAVKSSNEKKVIETPNP